MAEQIDLPFAPAPIPQHVAIIMDGNGRWAREHKRPRVFGHQKGADSIRNILYACEDWGIDYITLYAFSTENWKRPAEEVGALMRLLEEYLKREVRTLHKKNVRLKAIGDLSRLPARQMKILQDSIDKTANNTSLTLTLALSYGARDEICRAVRTIADKVQDGACSPAEIDEEMITAHLDTAGTPDPDLLIRTAGEMRLSNFLLWQLSYAEYYATPLYWPDFGRDAFAEAIRAYQQRTRKFGEVVE